MSWFGSSLNSFQGGAGISGAAFLFATHTYLINQLRLIEMEQAMEDREETALKNWFDSARYQSIAEQLLEIDPDFDSKKFLQLTLPRFGDLALLGRMRLMTEALHETLPSSYPAALKILNQLAPRLGHSFVSIVLPDYVGLYGLKHFELSMAALKYFTTFGSSEFGIRPFLREDLERTLSMMEEWSRDKDEAVRRLASEGCRPRLPWSFRLPRLIADPAPVAPILENLKADESLYVRKSVANHLNDISRDNPEWVLKKVKSWDLTNERTRWIVKRALRTLIKAGNAEALALLGVAGEAEVQVLGFAVNPPCVSLGGNIDLSLSVQSTSRKEQHLVIDYTVHYIKKSGASSAKVFKWKELNVGAGGKAMITRKQRMQNFTTRTHHSGRHQVDVTINGRVMATGYFDLQC